jgi:carbon storage regulator
MSEERQKLGQLVLSRKIGEVICIGDDIRLTLVSIEGHKIRLGIQAPRSVPIVRQELIKDWKSKEKPDASQSTEAIAAQRERDKAQTTGRDQPNPGHRDPARDKDAGVRPGQNRED